MPATQPDHGFDPLSRLRAMGRPRHPADPVDLLAALNAERPAKGDKPAEELDANAEGFRARAKREEERYRNATDSEYWAAVCFRTAGDLAAFLDAVGVVPVDGRWVHGDELARALGVTYEVPEDGQDAAPPEVDPLAALQALAAPADALSAEAVLAQLQAIGTADPLHGLPYVDDLAADSLMELEAVLAAFRAADTAPGTGRLVTDSPHWFAVCFPLRAHKEAFLSAVGLPPFADKYVDGHHLAAVLHVPLTTTDEGR
ncbi:MULTISPECIES: hypothetical protein [Actinosynnema]|uniref:hypothetical protein n=1 Tax=Actinosynnema TaxID=40566 RepID=UPI0020A33D94|nr:hypothetical protein [Actinosynnema pretiosum]MCP2092674.1 hypothetical protein [Actinosynnema pretiosum]